ncbi:uncharacterized protein LOC126973183 [Leptidea sinapis]|uniref:uncharacterized protein LOC126973183 n=1 Tax=Leptidea sinapis TaxID=189913 RepID=UPI00212A91F7|nr:uncharacterized protein LOC126973183 [Leptidea sinapis]
MNEGMDYEIEYLDEDAELVQQCVQPMEDNNILNKIATDDSTLLIEVAERPKRIKRKFVEEDSDYDPTEDKIIPKYRYKKKSNTSTPALLPKFRKHIPTTPKSKTERKDPSDLNTRRKLDIRIPDYEDPLCMPVRAFNKDLSDLKRLRTWNSLCLKHFGYHDIPFRADNKESVSSSRTVVLRNLFNKMTGKAETTLWSKVLVSNEEGLKKSEIIQTVLPKFREKETLSNVVLLRSKINTVHMRDEVILTKEQNNEEDTLVVYKVSKALAMLYKTFAVPGMEEDMMRNYLREVAVTKMCVYCYQTSSRNHNQKNNGNMKCSVCGRVCLSVYNLLAHLRSHDDATVRKHINSISSTLAQAVEYHYRCRVCQQKSPTITQLRNHIKTHKISEVFHCEIGNHLTS